SGQCWNTRCCDWHVADAMSSCRTLLFCRLVINFMEFGVFHLLNRLAQAIAEISAMLLNLVISSITALLHHCDHAFERLQCANVCCNACSEICRRAGAAHFLNQCRRQVGSRKMPNIIRLGAPEANDLPFQVDNVIGPDLPQEICRLYPADHRSAPPLILGAVLTLQK